MELTCFEIEVGRTELRPASRRRTWMDETPSSVAYRCIPLAVANVHGWVMLCPISFEVSWSGGAAASDLQIRRLTSDPEPRGFLDSHFGSGILTFNPMVVLRTEAGYNLWLAGPPNEFKDGIQAMSAVIETDWMPYTFSMNWKVTRKDTPIRFEKGDPFCFFFPIQRGAVAACEPKVAPITEQPELMDNYRWALARRDIDATLAERDEDRYQGWYNKGKMPKRGAGEAPAHETNVVARPFLLPDAKDSPKR